ncbi:hypothetical protein AN958_06086 [Leucoagaricus sp. SymC.cos]|nr:hypothetical protein AN958_06086 [Leucoagaricus sp. SymC.cos]
MSAHKIIVSGNEKYASSFDKGQLALPPTKKLVVVTCMDARIEPLSQLGFDLGDAHVIRNAGGLAQKALRSIVISQRLLGTREIAVFRHTGCGMLLFTSEQVRSLVRDAHPGDDEVSRAVGELDFLEFSNLEESVKADVKFLKENVLVLPETTITGWIHDVETGKVSENSTSYSIGVISVGLPVSGKSNCVIIERDLICTFFQTKDVYISMLSEIALPSSELRANDQSNTYIFYRLIASSSHHVIA